VTNPNTTIHDVATNQIEVREMTDEEYAEYLKMIENREDLGETQE
jgi:hypothetical protein